MAICHINRNLFSTGYEYRIILSIRKPPEIGSSLVHEQVDNIISVDRHRLTFGFANPHLPQIPTQRVTPQPVDVRKQTVRIRLIRWTGR